ncbi:FAD:protein FMN transferase [Enterococcus sp. DIV0876]|uniref:FAD:protein FMN transferase n=1 Tax=Enterococcus sp. DIV0876 TaxID=2774633 RepID=UPI003D2FDA0C
MIHKKRVFRGMGTLITIEVVHDAPDSILDEAQKQAQLFEMRFSANDPKSILGQVNQQAGKAAVQVPADLFQLIDLARQHSLPSDSYLNIAIGPLVQEWRIGFADANVPSAEKINALLPLTDPQHIFLNHQQQTVALAKGMQLDLGAVAKGFFADQLMGYFKQVGVAAALIDLGGNVMVYGDAPMHEDHLWRIGIQNPFLPRGNFAAAIKLRNKSVVTSGIYERTLNESGKTYHHIFDRQTGYPLASEIASLTIVSEKSVDGEIWTTRLFGQSPQKILSILATLTDITGIIITKQGELLYPREAADLIETV